MSEAPSTEELVSESKSEDVKEEKITKYGSRSKADFVWNVYKRIIVFPSSTSGAERKVGAALYILCFAIACAMVAAMVYSSDQSYTNYKMESGTSSIAVEHRAPDIVACPAKTLKPKYQFNVIYNDKMIEDLLGMKKSEVDEITQKKFDHCPKNKNCSEIKEACIGKFKKYCERLNEMVQDGAEKNFTVNVTDYKLGGLVTAQKALLYYMREENQGKWSLDMLWSSIISHLYTDLHPRYRDGFKYSTRPEYPWTIECFFFGSIGEEKGGSMCRESVRNMWVAKSYCGYIAGSQINETNTPYIGFNLREFWPMMYWLGSLESMEMNEKNFISNMFFEGYQMMSTISGVVHYSMTEINDLTMKKGKCQFQPLVAGTKLPCMPEEGEKNLKWFYEMNYQNRPYKRVWIYAKTKQTVTKKNSFTTYSQFQFAASLFSCFLGLSVMQILQVMLSKATKITKAGVWLEKFLQIAIFIALFVISFILTAKDLTTYFENRYNSVFKEKEMSLPVPMVQVCNDIYTSFGFINTTRFRDFDVSLTLANYIKYVGFQSVADVNIMSREISNTTDRIIELPEYMVRNMENGVETINNCSIPGKCVSINEPLKHFMVTSSVTHRTRLLDIDVHLKASAKLRTEAKKLSQKLGISEEASIAKLMEPFFLDPKFLIKQCTIGGVAFDCGKYGRYMFETGRHEVCLVVEIPSEELKSKELVGVDNALVISYDVNQYKTYSDVVSYYGPDVRDEEIDAGATCRAVDRTVPSGWFTKGGCYAGRSWKLKISHPEYFTQYIQIQHPEIGLAASESHIVDLRMNFDEKLREINQGFCFEQSEIICKYPREEAIHLSKGFQLHIRCGCAYCFIEDHHMLKSLSKILGKNVECCTVSQLTECYTSYLKKTTFNTTIGEYNVDEAFLNIATLAFDITGGIQGPNFANLNELRNAKEDWFKKMFFMSERVENETIVRFLDYIRNCFRQPCKLYTLEMFNYQNEKIDDGFVNVTVFYGAREGVGIQQVDRFDLAGFVGILMCGYSVTFGIGIVGLFELAYMLLKRLRGKTYETSSQVMHDHLIRAAGFLIDDDPEEKSRDSSKPIEDSPKEEKSQDSNEPTEHTPKKNQVAEDDESDEEIKVIEKQGSKNNLYASGSLVKTTNAWADPSEIISREDTSGTSNNSKKDILHVENTESNSKHEKIEYNSSSHVISGTLMSFALLLATGLMLLVIAYFFISMDNHEYNADVIVAPKIKKPSVILCADSQEKSEVLYKALGNSKCYVYWGTSTDCHDYFKIFVRNKKDRFCFVWDNSHEKEIELNQHHNDLMLDAANDMPDILIAVQGFSRTSLAKISPYIKWKNRNIMMGYTTKMKMFNSNCQSSKNDKKMGNCPSQYQEKNFPFSCGLKDEVLSPLEPENPCLWYQYSIGLAYSDSEQTKDPNSSVYKRLEVKPTQNNVLVFSVKAKHDLTRLLSIVGGIVGSFIEITILGLLSLVVFTSVVAFSKTITKGPEAEVAEKQ